MLMLTLSVALTGCARWFDSKPINPDIIGTSELQYDSKSQLCYVCIDSMQYIVTKVVSSAQTLRPIEGMCVTVFTTHAYSGIQAVLGKVSGDEIEKLYFRDGRNWVMAIVETLMLILSVALYAVAYVILNKDKSQTS